jgi:predicted GNAT family acetyltransferase
MPTLAPPETSSSSRAGSGIAVQELSVWDSLRFKIETSLRSMTRRFVNTFAFFEADLDHTVVAMPAGTQLSPRLFQGPSDTGTVCDLLAAMDNSQDELQRRMRRGDIVSIGFVDEEPVAYTWMTFQNADVKELALVLKLEPGELVQYDTFVSPQWRGRGFQYPLNVPVLNYAREHGYRKTLAWVHVLNTRSFKNQLRSGKRVIQKVFAINLPGTTRRLVLWLPGKLRSRLCPVR